MSLRDLIIVGAGPSGLSAAIAASRRGLDYQVVEQGTLVNSIFRFPPHMVFFTTPELLEIGGLPFVSPYDKPTRAEALQYYRRVVETCRLRIAYDEAVVGIEREGEGADAVFVLETRSSRGVGRVRQARQVVLAIGYYDHPNLLGVPGEDLAHVHHYYTEPHGCFQKRVVIVGGGNSAAEAALELYRSGAHVTLVHRDTALKSTIKYWVRPDIENRFKEGSIASRMSTLVRAITPNAVQVRTSGLAADGQTPVERDEDLAADVVFLLTGYRADSGLLTRAGIRLNEREAPVLDPETFETGVPGLFVAGGAIAGIDTGTIFIENGRFHGEKIVEVIASRLEQAG